MKLFYPEPDLTDGVVRLRRWELADGECARRGAADDAISGDVKIEVVPPERAHELIERKWSHLDEGRGVCLAISEAGGAEAIGQIWIGVRPQPGVVGLGYWLLPEVHRRGFGVRAARLAADWALGPLGAARMEAWIRPDNTASLATIAAAGFQRDGVLRSFLAFADGHRSDMVVWSRLPGDREI